MKKPIFNWEEETGTALCVIYDKDKVYYGNATCHPDDRDMISEKTGCEIAYRRACIMRLKSLKEEFKLEYKTLKKCYYSMNTSKYFNPKSYEARRIVSHMQQAQENIEAIKYVIEE